MFLVRCCSTDNLTEGKIQYSHPIISQYGIITKYCLISITIRSSKNKEWWKVTTQRKMSRTLKYTIILYFMLWYFRILPIQKKITLYRLSCKCICSALILNITQNKNQFWSGFPWLSWLVIECKVKPRTKF